MDENLKKNWTYNEGKALIEVYKNRKDEYFTTRNKKDFWQNILTDLESMNVLVSHTTWVHTQAKWKCLSRAYKCAKDRGTGCGPSKFLYMTEMDDVFESTPLINRSHTVSVGATPVDVQLASTLPRSVVPTSSAASSTSTSSENQLTSSLQNNAPKRKNKKDTYELKKKHYEKKENYYEKKLQEHRRRTKMQEEYLKKKEEARNQRMQCILNYLQNKTNNNP